MRRSIVAFALALLTVPGCGGTSSPPTASPRPTFVWDVQTRSYDVIGVSASNVPRLGDQSRNAEAIYPDATSRKEIEEALQEIYRELKDDIERAQPDADYRRITIQIYDSAGDEEYDPDAYLCRLEVAPEPGAPLADFPADAVIWQWRDPEAKPDRQTRQIEWEYLDVLNEINRSVLDPLVRLPGMTAAEHRAALEAAYKAESEELKRQIADKYDLSVEELEELLDRVLRWKYEGASASPD